MKRGARAGGLPWRAALRVAVCILAGVAVTALTAAASLLYAPKSQVPGVGGGFSSDDREGHAPGSVVFKPGELYLSVGMRETMDYWLWIASENPVPGEPKEIYGAGVPTVNVGWPMLAFTSPPVTFAEAGSFAEFKAAIEHAYAHTTTTAAPELLRARPHRVVPGRILPLGFAVNTLLYAAVAGAVIFAPGIIRRHLRRRSGRCIGCGYPLTGGEVCPECGEVPAGEHQPLKAAVGDTNPDLPFAICPFAISPEAQP